MPNPFASGLAALAGAALFAVMQDPPAPVPPTPAAAVPSAAVLPKAHALEGVYELRRRVVEGREAQDAGRGHLAITRRHLFLCFVGPGPDPDHLLLRSGVRTWQTEGDRLRTKVELGWFTDEEGAVHVEPPGTIELRRVVQARGLLRVHQSEVSYLEFERVE
jgi:hypothetical protein